MRNRLCLRALELLTASVILATWLILVGCPNPATDNVTSKGTNPVAPLPPSDFAARAISANAVALTWTDNSDNEESFEIERSLDGSTGWNELATTTANATTYDDSALTTGTSYWYRVCAVNGAGSSSYSNTDSAIPAVTYTLAVTIDSAGAGYVTKNPSLSQYPPGTVVRLTASAYSGHGFSSWSGDASGTANPTSITMGGNRSVTANFVASLAPPSTVSATKGMYYDYIEVSWDAVPGATGYNAYSSSVDNPTLVDIANGAVVTGISYQIRQRT